jgi:hypothetical protein
MVTCLAGEVGNLLGYSLENPRLGIIHEIL